MKTKLLLACVVLGLIGCCTLTSLGQIGSAPAKGGFVPDEITAIKIAEAVLIPIYGSDQVKSEKPFHAKLKDKVWIVTGTLPEGADGGVAEVRMSRLTGQILSVKHGK